MSSMKAGENPAHRKAKVSRATSIDPGLVGPKAYPKGEVDGHQVNIPELGIYRLTEGVTEKGSTSTDWLLWCKVVGGIGRQIRWSIQTLRTDAEAQAEVCDPKLPRKAS